ncbi:hypothetical protein SAMN05216311_114180 [Chitinophaga sp. CF418]|nr:hypothetical protein SAMN05216311_114180 [Chitinophaga sp. CF418]
MVYQRHYKIGFGDYEGSSIQEIITQPPQYVLWCIVNLYHFSINQDIFLDKTLSVEGEYLRALEINLIKHKLIKKWHKPENHQRHWDDDYDDGHDDYYEYPSYEQWLEDEFGDDAETAYWNLD